MECSVRYKYAMIFEMESLVHDIIHGAINVQALIVVHIKTGWDVLLFVHNNFA